MFFWNRSDASEFDTYGWDESDPPPASWYVQRFFLFAVIVAGGIGVGAAMYGQAMAEKAVTALAHPVGLVWIFLAMMTYFGMLRRRYFAASFGFLCWLIVTVAGNQFVCNSLASSLESGYYHMNPYEDDDFQYGLLLGGGTEVAPHGQSQLNMNGDRLLVAFRMYRAGKIKKIICSGTNSFSGDESTKPADTALEILQDLGVPENDLLLLPGRNTSEEMANLKLWVQQQKDDGIDVGRVALISSAWHLPRAQRLARDQELETDPAPANFLSEPFAPSPHMIIPGAYQLLVTSKILKEFWAGAVQR